MPTALLTALGRMIPRLRAEEAWTTMLAVALGSGRLSEQDAATIRDRWLAEMRDGEAEPARPPRAAQLLATLEQMGLEVER